MIPVPFDGGERLGAHDACSIPQQLSAVDRSGGGDGDGEGNGAAVVQAVVVELLV